MSEMDSFDRGSYISDARKRAEEREAAADRLGLGLDVIQALTLAIGTAMKSDSDEIVLSKEAVLEKTKTESLFDAAQVLSDVSGEIYGAYEHQGRMAEIATDSADRLENNAAAETLVA
jgi:hypothetical protein